MSELPNFDLTIAGAGMVGATLAVLVSQWQPTRRIALVDPMGLQSQFKGEPDQFDPRVVALNAQSVAILASIGCWEAVKNLRATPYRAMSVWDGEGTAAIEFDARDVHADQLGYIVESSALRSVLHQSLSQCTNVEILTDSVEQYHSEPDGISVMLGSGDGLLSPLLVGADGAHSKVRQLAGFATREWDYGQSAIVTTVRTEYSHQNIAWQRFTDHGPLAFLPLANTDQKDAQWCSIVWSIDDQALDAIMALDTPAFCQALTRAFEGRLGQVEWADKRVVLPLKQRHVTQYYRDNVTLVGDAAHTLHPLAGQGVNLGLRDVQVLAEELKRAQARGVSLQECATLKRYQRRVQTHNLLAMGVMEGFKRLYHTQNPWWRVMRNWGLQRVQNTALAKRELIRLAMGQTG